MFSPIRKKLRIEKDWQAENFLWLLGILVENFLYIHRRADTFFEIKMLGISSPNTASTTRKIPHM